MYRYDLASPRMRYPGLDLPSTSDLLWESKMRRLWSTYDRPPVLRDICGRYGIPYSYDYLGDFYGRTDPFSWSDWNSFTSRYPAHFSPYTDLYSDPMWQDRARRLWSSLDYSPTMPEICRRYGIPHSPAFLGDYYGRIDPLTWPDWYSFTTRYPSYFCAHYDRLGLPVTEVHNIARARACADTTDAMSYRLAALERDLDRTYLASTGRPYSSFASRYAAMDPYCRSAMYV